MRKYAFENKEGSRITDVDYKGFCRYNGTFVPADKDLSLCHPAEEAWIILNIVMRGFKHLIAYNGNVFVRVDLIDYYQEPYWIILDALGLQLTKEDQAFIDNALQKVFSE